MIDFHDVWARRGESAVLRGATLAVGAGETLALVGRSGAGKTTLLRLVNRLTTADRGAVVVDGRDTREWDAVALRRRVGYVVQDVGLFPHFTVDRNVATVPQLLGWEATRIEARVAELLTLVGLDPPTFRTRWPDELSGGQRQRVGLARALAADPSVLLMDEPFGALDPMTRLGLHEAFRTLQAGRRRTVLLVTHDISEAFAIADRVAVVDEGRVIACASPALLAEVADPRVRALLETRFG
ncbi:MAG: ATP-binding cassette domain-containing protein [Vicinamibacterales bacterium]